MELLIPGLILVALMIYASTRIKRTAAQAFEAETIEADEFVIEKPEGFLNVIGGDARYAFEAYSKEFGGPGAEEYRQATATLTVSDTDPAEVLSSGGRNEVVGGLNYLIAEENLTEKGVEFVRSTKTVTKDGKTYRFELKRLAETSPEFVRKTEEMVDSFRLK